MDAFREAVGDPLLNIQRGGLHKQLFWNGDPCLYGSITTVVSVQGWTQAVAGQTSWQKDCASSLTIAFVTRHACVTSPPRSSYLACLLAFLSLLRCYKIHLNFDSFHSAPSFKTGWNWLQFSFLFPSFARDKMQCIRRHQHRVTYGIVVTLAHWQQTGPSPGWVLPKL